MEEGTVQTSFVVGTEQNGVHVCVWGGITLPRVRMSWLCATAEGLGTVARSWADTVAPRLCELLQSLKP